MSDFDYTATEQEQLTVFVETYVATNDPVLSCVRARLTDPTWPIEITAERILNRVDVQTAIDVIKKTKQNAESFEITRESVIADTQMIFQKCLNSGDYKAALAAKRLQSELNRWLGQDITITHKKDASMLTDADLDRIARGKTIDGEFENVTPSQSTALVNVDNIPSRSGGGT